MDNALFPAFDRLPESTRKKMIERGPVLANRISVLRVLGATALGARIAISDRSTRKGVGMALLWATDGIDGGIKRYGAKHASEEQRVTLDAYKQGGPIDHWSDKVAYFLSALALGAPRPALGVIVTREIAQASLRYSYSKLGLQEVNTAGNGGKLKLAAQAGATTLDASGVASQNIVSYMHYGSAYLAARSFYEYAVEYERSYRDRFDIPTEQALSNGQLFIQSMRRVADYMIEHRAEVVPDMREAFCSMAAETLDINIHPNVMAT